MLLQRSPATPGRLDRVELNIEHVYTVDRSSFLSRDISVSTTNISQPSYCLKRKMTHKIYYKIEQTYPTHHASKGITLSAERRAFRRTVSLKSTDLNLYTELRKLSLFSTKYSFVWNGETYIWKRHEYGNLNLACLCPRTGKRLAEFRWKSPQFPQLKAMGELSMTGFVSNDPDFQSVLVAAFLITLDTLLEC
ncbi:hypothetical protein K7432_016118 [Basidiobolus ranarum]|uniref:Tubby C-terminal domain-containing protein n=1 Tax=Basidiobolus ranarum TaxID=34480 RepID=A0ABR2WF61_9FUNG